MISVSIKTHQNEILELWIHGHANAAPHGEDLVCAGVSTVAIGLLNAMQELAPDTCQLLMGENETRIQVTTVTDTNQLILKIGCIQLETIENSYKKFIRIKKQEV